MPQPESNPPRPSPSPATCPRCGRRLPVHGDTVGPCPLCREAPLLEERSTDSSMKVLTATDHPVQGIAARPAANKWVLLGAILVLAIIGAVVYFVA